MKVTLNWYSDFDEAPRKAHVVIERDASDPPRFTSESWFWYRIKEALNVYGWGFIKKCPALDGHLTDAPYYLVTRSKIRGARVFMIHDSAYMIRDLAREFNDTGTVTLLLTS